MLAELEEGCKAVLGKRRPLTRDAKAKPEVKLFNPRFEDDFATGKDYDPDRWDSADSVSSAFLVPSAAGDRSCACRAAAGTGRRRAS